MIFWGTPSLGNHHIWSRLPRECFFFFDRGMGWTFGTSCDEVGGSVSNLRQRWQLKIPYKWMCQGKNCDMRGGLKQEQCGFQEPHIVQGTVTHMTDRIWWWWVVNSESGFRPQFILESGHIHGCGFVKLSFSIEQFSKPLFVDDWFGGLYYPSYIGDYSKGESRS